MWKNSKWHIIGMVIYTIVISFLLYNNPLDKFALGLFTIAVLSGMILGFLFEMLQKIWHTGTVSKTDFYASVLGGVFGWIIALIIRCFLW